MESQVQLVRGVVFSKEDEASSFCAALKRSGVTATPFHVVAAGGRASFWAVTCDSWVVAEVLAAGYAWRHGKWWEVVNRAGSRSSECVRSGRNESVPE